MALAPTDQRDLVEPLFAGLVEHAPWAQFLRRLIARTGAERAGLLLRGPGGARLDTREEAFAVSREVRQARAELDTLPLPPGLRPMRVYGFSELDEIFGQTLSAGPGLAAAAISFGRLMRVPAGAGWEAWLIIEHSRREFAAADSALMADLAPHIAIAVALLRELDHLRRRAEIAENALAAAGVSQALLDGDRRQVAGDPGNLGAFSLRPGTTLQLPGARGGELARAMAAAAGRGHATAMPGSGERAGADLLIRPAPPSEAAVPLPGAAVALTRTPRVPDSAAAALLAALHGLSEREAQLALSLSAGTPLIEAGHALGLTAETTRNYSKRIYAKTGTAGQADLVRLVLSGVVPFAGAG